MMQIQTENPVIKEAVLNIISLIIFDFKYLDKEVIVNTFVVIMIIVKF